MTNIHSKLSCVFLFTPDALCVINIMHSIEAQHIYMCIKYYAHNLKACVF